MKYLTIDGYIMLDEKGNTYCGTFACVLMNIFIKHDIKDYHTQKEILDYATKENKLVLSN